MKQKAARNKTIDFTLEEGHVYLERMHFGRKRRSA